MATEKTEIKPLTVTTKKFSEVYDGSTPWEATHKTVLGKPIVILKATKVNTGYGEAFLATCEVDGGEHKVLMGGKVIIKQLEEILSHLPVATTIIKQGRYYTFS